MTMDTQPWSRDEFERRLREQGQAYHIHHPFNVMLNTGQATPEQIRGWVANRFCYQVAIPIKDAAVLSNCTDRENGSSEFLIMMATISTVCTMKAVSKPGFGWDWQSG